MERELRNEGLPADHNVRNLHLIWLSLEKTFKVKHKFIDKNKNQNVWAFYDDLKIYHETYESRSKMENTEDVELGESSDHLNKTFAEDALESDDLAAPGDVSELKHGVLLLSCRACAGSSPVMTPLFASVDGTTLYQKMSACTAVTISQDDVLPQCLCQPCLDELNAAYKFRKKCSETDVLLRTSWFSQQSDSQKVKKEIPTDQVLEELESKNLITFSNEDNGPFDYYSDSDDKNNTVKSDKKIKSIKQKERKARKKSKNLILIPISMADGKKAFKRRYVYWKVCELCGKSTHNLNQHMKAHSGIKSYKCSLCPKTFTYRASLQTHVKTHNPTPLKICQLCGKEFFRNLSYKRHLVFHANERKFACETCGKTFNTNDILRIHIRSHTGERPYSCQTCGKSFYSRGCVSRHQKVHRKMVAPK